MLFLAVLLGIMGTILFIRGLARLLSLLAGSNKRNLHKGFILSLYGSCRKI